MCSPFDQTADRPPQPPAGMARRSLLVLFAGGAAPPALAASRAQAPDDLQGREVWSLDETRIGTVLSAARTAKSAMVLVAPALGLGIGAAPLAFPASLLREASEGRLVLIMGPGEFHATVAAARLSSP